MEKMLDAELILSPKAKGKRLRIARHMAGFENIELLMEKYQGKYPVSYGTWRGWEAGAGEGLSEKGADNACKIFAEEGVLCTTAWLTHAVGKGPQLVSLFDGSNSAFQQFADLPEHKQQTNVLEELSLFKQHYPDTLDFVIPDNTMAPRFIIGEYVAGIKCTGNMIEKTLGKDCIIQTTSGEIFVRNLREKTGKNSYTLACTNMPETNKPFLYEISIQGLAPIIWQRRPGI
jgi:hypothetical protein